jgi:hypothetical protein
MITTNAEFGLQAAVACGYYLEIIARDGTRSQPELKVFKPLIIQAQAGEQYSVISSQGEQLSDNVVVTRTYQDLDVRFDNGGHLVIEDYYLVFGHFE